MTQSNENKTKNPQGIGPIEAVLNVFILACVGAGGAYMISLKYPDVSNLTILGGAVTAVSLTLVFYFFALKFIANPLIEKQGQKNLSPESSD